MSSTKNIQSTTETTEATETRTVSYGFTSGPDANLIGALSVLLLANLLGGGFLTDLLSVLVMLFAVFNLFCSMLATFVVKQKLTALGVYFRVMWAIVLVLSIVQMTA